MRTREDYYVPQKMNLWSFSNVLSLVLMHPKYHREQGDMMRLTCAWTMS